MCVYVHNPSFIWARRKIIEGKGRLFFVEISFYEFGVIEEDKNVINGYLALLNLASAVM